jgi:hypothetical protein
MYFFQIDGKYVGKADRTVQIGDLMLLVAGSPLPIVSAKTKTLTS